MVMAFAIPIDARFLAVPRRVSMSKIRVEIVVTAPESELEVPDCTVVPTTVYVLYVPDFATLEGSHRFIAELRTYRAFARATTSPWTANSTGVQTITCVCDDAEDYLAVVGELRELGAKYARK